MNRFYFKQNEIIFLKTVCEMLENNLNINHIKNDNQININAMTIAIKSGISYPTVRKNIKKIMEL